MSYNVLAIGAHPDDIEFGCFGTLKKHLNDGDNVTMVVMTQSDVKDAHTQQVTRDSSQSVIEAHNAADVIGAELILGPFQDTKVPFDNQSVAFLEKIIKEKKIDIIYTHWAGDTHQDHINTPIEFLTQLASLSKYFHLMSDEDRDYVNCAKEALEDQIEWRI